MFSSSAVLENVHLFGYNILKYTLKAVLIHLIYMPFCETKHMILWHKSTFLYINIVFRIKAHDGITPLLAAVEFRHIETVQILLEHGANPNIW